MQSFTFFVSCLWGGLLIGSLSNAWAEITPVGWQESIYFSDEKLWAEAKVDTGADHSSLHAQNIVYFDKDGQPWVRFNLLGKFSIEKPLLKTTQIKAKAAGQAASVRPVVALRICMANQTRQIAFNLVNRQHLKVPVLIGRFDMPTTWMVNPHQTHLLSGHCAD